MERERRLELKVGLFVVFCLSLLVASLLVLGDEQNLFERNYAFAEPIPLISACKAPTEAPDSGSGQRQAYDLARSSLLEYWRRTQR